MSDALTARRQLTLVVLLALLANVAALGNGFAYDDVWIIQKNARVADASWLAYFGQTYWNDGSGTGLYRPLAIFGYAVQWVLGDGEPWLFHAVNLALHAAVTAAVWRLARLLVSPTGTFVAAALFAVHPVHVEAVANVVGQAELWVALCVLSALVVYLEGRRRGPLTAGETLQVAGLGFLGLGFKEHAVVLPATLVAAELLLRDTADRPVDRARRLLPVLLLWGVLAAGYFWGRLGVLREVAGDTPHPSLAGLDMAGRARVMLGIVPEWVRLLTWPARLVADYSPREVFVSAQPHWSQAPGALIVVLAAVLWLLARRVAPGAAVALLLGALALAPTANLLIPTGILASERTLYLPSAGMLIALGAVVPWAQRYATRAGRRGATLLASALLLAVGLGLIRSNDRAPAWRDNATVFTQLVADAPMSFKAHYAYGGWLFEQKRNLEAELEWRYAIALAPWYDGVRLELAHRYRGAHVCPAAIPLYREALAIEPEAPAAIAGLVACHLELAQFREARAWARAARARGYSPRAFAWLAERADSALAVLDSGDARANRRWRGAGAATAANK